MMRQKNSNVQTTPLKEFAKKVAFRNTPFFKPTYPYNVHPIQLSRIISSIDEVAQDKSRRLCIVEVGVARGNTSRFIVEHVQRSGYDVDFYCIDTFSSFTQEDLNFEVEERGKTLKELRGFAYNDFDIWKGNFSEFEFVHPVKVDASKFDFSAIAPVDFCFLDVDLYIPTKNVLANIWQHMADPAILMCDDVRDEGRWDGSYQAFMEFVDANSLDYEIVGTKCGMVRFPQ